jgi:hypothetical protein
MSHCSGSLISMFLITLIMYWEALLIKTPIIKKEERLQWSEAAGY